MANGRRWDRATVIEAFRVRHRKGQTLVYAYVQREDGALTGAANRHFGTYREAVIAAGLNYDRDVRRLRSWTKASIVRAIRRRRRTGDELAPGHVSVDDKPLYMACVVHFGSYRAAVEAAGIPYDRVLRPVELTWPAPGVLAEIRRRHRRGEDLSHNGLKQRHHPLLAAAARRFGTYRAAVTAAGIDYASVKAVRKWDEERVVGALRRLRRAKRDVSPTALKARDPSLYYAMGHCCGSYDAALTAAGLDAHAVRRQRRPWTAADVLSSPRPPRRYRPFSGF